MWTSTHQSYEAFCALSDLIHRLGLPINEDKRSPPCKALTCLGININLASNVLSIEQEKLQAIYSECLKIRSAKALSKKAYQSLLGKLLYLHKCVHPARIFVNRMLFLFRQNHDKKRIKLSPDFFKDLDWFIQFVPHFNGKILYKKPSPQTMDTVFVDASLTGIGGYEKIEFTLSPYTQFTTFRQPLYTERC